MKGFKPYKIYHIYLNETLTLPHVSADFSKYFVFWWNNLALGHSYIQHGIEITESVYYDELIKSIKPSIIYHLNGSDRNEDWSHLIKTTAFNDWVVWANRLFSKHTIVKIPATVPVSIVICTRNRATILEKCLTAINNLQCLPEEIVVVDNAPDDDSTKKVVEKFGNIKYVLESRPGLDIARNTGIVNSTCPIIAYTDDDVIVHDLWMYNVWDTFKMPNIGAMTGLIIAQAIDTEAQYIFEKYWSFNRGYTDKVYDRFFYQSKLLTGPPVWEIGAGANMAFRRSIFQKTGQFDELLDVGAAGCNGDSEMWFRILSKGIDIAYNPRAIAYHEHRRDMKGLKKQLFYYMRGFAAAALIQQRQVPEADYLRFKIKRFPQYYCKLIFKDFPRFSRRLKTLPVEVSGLLSGIRYYHNTTK